MPRPSREYTHRALSWLGAFLALGSLSVSARAEEPAAPKPSAKLDLLPRGGATSSGLIRFEWAATSFGVERSHFVNSMGFGVAFSPWTPRIPEGMRFLNVGAMLYVGDYGDDRHGPVAGQFSYRPEFRIADASVVSVYFGTPFAWTFSPVRNESRIGHMFSAGAAFGFEVLNGGITFEGSGAMAFAPGDVFRPMGATGGKVWEPRGQLTIGTNICGFLGAGGFCEHDAPVSQQVDLTEALKALVREALDPGNVAHPPACAAIATAASVRSDDVELPGRPRCVSIDQADRFFCRLQNASVGEPYAPNVDKVVKLHDALSHCYRQFQVDAKAANLQSRSMRHAEQYLVDPSEIQRVAHCEADADPYVESSDQLKLACEVCPAVAQLMPEACN